MKAVKMVFRWMLKLKYHDQTGQTKKQQSGWSLT